MTEINTSTPLKVTVHPLPENSAVKPAAPSFWDGETPSFKDILDTINPLQHIPIVSNLYQSLTGDVPSQGSQIIGGTLFGGAIGLLSSIFNSIIQNETGKNIRGNIIATLEGHSSTTWQTTGTDDVPFLTGSQRTAYNAYVQAGKLS